MKKVTLKNPEALRKLLDLLITSSNFNFAGKSAFDLLNTALPEEEAPKWEPKDGDTAWLSLIEYSYICQIKFGNGFIEHFENGLIHPTKEAAEKHLAWYKEALKNKPE